MGKEHPDRMSDVSFRLMDWWFRIHDRVSGRPGGLGGFGIREGDVVVDYGCGPGRYLEEASARVGPAGRVYAVDIHELAILRIGELASGKGLSNVIPLKARGYSVDLPDGAADLIYALDMFHMVSDPKAFLSELRRIARPGAVLILEDGHQARRKTLAKLSQYSGWRVARGEKRHVRCIAV